jgi:hypothetical protein
MRLPILGLRLRPAIRQAINFATWAVMMASKWNAKTSGAFRRRSDPVLAVAS